MRRVCLLFTSAAIAEIAVIAVAFFVEPIWPLGDFRWLFLAIVSLFSLIILLYFEYRREQRIRRDERLIIQARDLLDDFRRCQANAELQGNTQSIEDLNDLVRRVLYESTKPTDNERRDTDDPNAKS